VSPVVIALSGVATESLGRREILWQSAPMPKTPTLEMICGDDFRGRCSVGQTEFGAAATAQQLLSEFNRHVHEKHLAAELAAVAHS
jgi:hypothetical protein